MLGLAKPFQMELNEIAEKVEASNQRWYKFILTGNMLSEILICNVLRTDFHASLCNSFSLLLAHRNKEKKAKIQFGSPEHVLLRAKNALSNVIFYKKFSCVHSHI